MDEHRQDVLSCLPTECQIVVDSGGTVTKEEEEPTTESGMTVAEDTTDMPQGSQGALSQRSSSSQSSAASHSSSRSGVKTDDPHGLHSNNYHGSDAWWSVGEFLQQGITHQSVGLSLSNRADDELWDLSDSLQDLYRNLNHNEAGNALVVRNHRDEKVDVKKWIEQDTSHGFVRVFSSDSEESLRLFPCTLNTTSQKLCHQCGTPSNSLHVQLNGDIIHRVEPFDCPLALQNEYLQSIGYTDICKIQEVGCSEDLHYLVKFYAGKPASDRTYSRKQLTACPLVRKGKLIYQWVPRRCVISGTRLLIYRDRHKTTRPTIVQLAKGSLEEVQFKGHEYCMRLTSTLQGERSVYLSFDKEMEYRRWLKKAKKATAKLPTKADLSGCHLEFLPEAVFINEGLQILNLRHNVLKERPIEEDIYTIGWIDDLPRFYYLQSLNLADNELKVFPSAVCRIKTLTELNMASNKLEEIPPDVQELVNLKIFHVHNNHLTTLPEEITKMPSLSIIVLAFNHFTTVPTPLLNSQDSSVAMESLVMAGNMLERLAPETLQKMKHIKKIDFRMNKLLLLPSETSKFHLLEQVTHLDIRDNQVSDLDIRALKCLEYLNCERNKIHSLQVNGTSLKNLFATQNELDMFSINPKPEWMINIDLSYNKLESLPNWICDCFFMVQLDASHNRLRKLPERLLVDAQKLRILKVNNNDLEELPPEIDNSVIEEFYLQRNHLKELPDTLFVKLSKLRYLNATGNGLQDIPSPNPNTSLNKVQEMYLSDNQLGDKCVKSICCFQRLKVLHLAYNDITEIPDRDMSKLETLQELNLTGNKLRHLPSSLGRHKKLQVLRANNNLLREIPDFRQSPNLKVLELGSNRLRDISVTNLIASQVMLLDISGNPNIQVNTTELEGIKVLKKLCLVDMRGQNRSLLDLRTAAFENVEQAWQSGFSQTSGMRNKLSVSVVNMPQMSSAGEGCFAIFDGGRNDEVVKELETSILTILLQEAAHQATHQKYMKYAMLSAHRSLRATGQKVGASAALCHLQRMSGHYILNVANVGDTEVVVCRRQEAVCLTKKFTIIDNSDECQRIIKSDGIVTEDGRVNGVTFCTRQLGCSYLFPHVIPDPHVVTTTLHPEDQLLIMANQGLWKYISYQEAVNEIIGIPDSVVAAKRLQDLAQGYGSQENIAILVVRLLLTDAERFRVKNILHNQFEEEQLLLTQLKGKDKIREENKKKRLSAHQEESVPMDIVKLKVTKKRTQVNELFPLDNTVDGVQVKPIPDVPDGNQMPDLADWEMLLQKRLTEEVKNKELKYVFLNSESDSLEKGDGSQDIESNWSTLSNNDGKVRATETEAWVEKQVYNNHAPAHPHGCAPPACSSESQRLMKELKMPAQVDRDAILFHEMQMARARNHSNSTDSMDSTQSEQVYSSARQNLGGRISSHSIEVLIHNPDTNNTDVSFGGSFPDNGTLDKNKKAAAKVLQVGGSCPFTVTTENNQVPIETSSNNIETVKSPVSKQNDVKTKSKIDRKDPLSEVKGTLPSKEILKLPSVTKENYIYDSSGSENELQYFSFPETKVVVADIHKSQSNHNGSDNEIRSQNGSANVNHSKNGSGSPNSQNSFDSPKHSQNSFDSPEHSQNSSENLEHSQNSSESLDHSVHSLEDLLHVGLQQASVNSKVLISEKCNSSSNETISSSRSLSQQSVIITYL